MQNSINIIVTFSIDNIQNENIKIILLLNDIVYYKNKNIYKHPILVNTQKSFEYGVPRQKKKLNYLNYD